MKITRQESKLHDQALDLLFGSDKELTQEQVEFVYDNYSAMANHDVTKGSIYFTPTELAHEFATATGPKGVVCDLGAGIGALAYACLHRDYGGWNDCRQLRGEIRRMICIEQDDEFVAAGKRLLPEAEWYHGSVYDLDLLTSLGSIDCVISNPPYGHIPSKCDWTKVSGPGEWHFIEIALRLAYNGASMILPHELSDYDLDRHEYRKNEDKLKYLEPHFPGVAMSPWSTVYSGFRFKGTNISVCIIDINVDDVDWPRPYGFRDVLKETVDETPIQKSLW